MTTVVLHYHGIMMLYFFWEVVYKQRLMKFRELIML